MYLDEPHLSCCVSSVAYLPGEVNRRTPAGRATAFIPAFQVFALSGEAGGIEKSGAEAPLFIVTI